MRVIVLCDGSIVGKAAVYVREQLGPKQSLTPEGYLLCEDVPLARTGDQLYADGETPIPAGPNGYVIITREEAEVFRPEFVRSFEGKPFLLRHPPGGLVSPETWKRYARGHVMNPRRGEGALRDFIIGDVLVTDPETIELITSGKMREVSSGYVAEYDELEPKGSGRGLQRDMIANHVALVESARCGPACAINDHSQGEHMRKTTVDNATVTADQVRAPFLARIAQIVAAVFRATPTADAAAVANAIKPVLDEMPMTMAGGDQPGGVHLHMPGGAQRDEEAHRLLGDISAKLTQHDDMFQKLVDHTGYKDAAADPDAAAAAAAAAEKAKAGDADEETKKRLEEEAPAGTGDAARVATDSSFLAQAHQEAASGAEILLPGMTIPAFDKTAKPKKTLDDICALRRRALELSYSTADGKIVIDRIAGSKPNFATMDCKAERLIFRAAVSQKKVVKDAADQARARALAETAKAGDKKLIRSAADLNAYNRAHWAAKK